MPFNKLFYACAPAVFVLLLLLPFADERLKLSGNGGINEQRRLTEFPRFNADSIKTYPKSLETYYNDHFGFRSTLIQLGSKVKYHVFGISPLPEKVEVGSEGWFFLAGRFYEITQDLNRENLYQAETLKKDVEKWEQRRLELARLNIRYFKAMWPDKHLVYPEYLPLGMKLVDSRQARRCDQALRYLKEHQSPVHIVDPRPVLEKEKKNNQLYYKHDSHWNDLGAFFAYRELAAAMQMELPAIRPPELSDFTITWRTRKDGDLANLMSVKVEEEEPRLMLKKGAPVLEPLPHEAYPAKTEIYRNKNAQTKLRALIYRDSFTTALIPLLAENFYEIVLIWDTDYSLDMVNKVKPDVVIECYASRYFR